jgi:type IX secretion system PorP/SprF family membrane protein
MKLYKLIFPVLFFKFIFSFPTGYSQQVPDIPVSYRIFSPFIFNPAVVGSKDFSSIDLLISNYGKSNSQVASGNMRLTKSKEKYFSSPAVSQFSNLGIGGYFINYHDSISRNKVIGGTGSYHIKLDKEALSFISFGITAKAIFNKYAGDAESNIPEEDTFNPNLDAGIFYYNSRFYAGISATNLLDNATRSDSVMHIPWSRQFFLNTGYKIIISKTKNILLEPFIIVNYNDSVSGDIGKMLKPGLTFYANNFRLGTYFNDFNKLSFFAQFKYSKAYIGTYFEFPYKSAFYFDPIIVELAVGLNLSSFKKGFPGRNHW